MGLKKRSVFSVFVFCLITLKRAETPVNLGLSRESVAKSVLTGSTIKKKKKKRLFVSEHDFNIEAQTEPAQALEWSPKQNLIWGLQY